ncbi:MAG: division/cell wall cluster transcriptional repressor MraZ [Parerythrobacter sp.]
MSQVRVSYSGQAYSPAGDKGRFALPSAFRKTVKEASDNKRVVCLDTHATWPCIVGFGLNREDELQDQLDREYDVALNAGREFDYDARSLALFGFDKVPFDDSGRFTLPPHLASAAKVDGGLFIRGAGRFFTLWSPSELYRMGDEMAKLKAECESFVAQAGAKAA